jgi:2-C-methyl-D-erythritol 4-phosphate cytidylyltransferase
MGGDTPKQYLRVGGHPLLYYALRRLAGHPQISQVFVVLAPGDTHFRLECAGEFEGTVRPLYCGGETRSASVYNGLLAARDALDGDDWVLVHDAARPCVSTAAIDRLIAELGDDEVGGLLAVPLADTLKRSDGASRVIATESREALWQAQTPQMFRYGFLVEALRRCGSDAVTDEAGAMERIGLRPRLVMGELRNLKVTYPEDLALAERLLESER